MERLTIRIPEDVLEEIEARASADDVSQSEAARQLLRRGSEYDDLKRENERLRDQLAATNRRIDEHQELVEYVEEERSVQRQREEREQRRAQAGVLTRAKWWITGMPADEETDGE